MIKFEDKKKSKKIQTLRPLFWLLLEIALMVQYIYFSFHFWQVTIEFPSNINRPFSPPLDVDSLAHFGVGT